MLLGAGASEGGAPSACSSVSPYVTTETNVTSIDSTQADVCTLRISTCKAHEDFSETDCEASENAPDPSLCGEPDLDDAGCELFEAAGNDNIYRCTVRCSSDVDCKEDHVCESDPDPDVCSLEPVLK